MFNEEKKENFLLNFDEEVCKSNVIMESIVLLIETEFVLVFVKGENDQRPVLILLIFNEDRQKWSEERWNFILKEDQRSLNLIDEFEKICEDERTSGDKAIFGPKDFQDLTI